MIHNPFSHVSGWSFAICGLNIAIWPWCSYKISLTMPAMCSLSLQTPKKRYHTCFYDAYFKSNDTSHICVAAILNYPIWPPEGKFSLSAGGFRKALIITIIGRNLIKLYKSERLMWYDRLSTPTIALSAKYPRPPDFLKQNYPRQTSNLPTLISQWP